MSHPVRRFLLPALVAVFAGLALACTAEEQPHTPSESAPVYVAIGASDSVGTGARNPPAEGWVSVLHSRMPAGTRLVNLGIGGLQMSQALDQVLPVAVDVDPSVVSVWLGVNDFAADVSLDAYRAGLDALLRGLRQDTSAQIYVANLPDLTLLPAFKDRERAALQVSVRDWNTAIAASVEANGAVLVDLYEGWTELRSRPEYISRDGLHPSSRGHRRIADLFWAAVGSRQSAVGE